MFRSGALALAIVVVVAGCGTPPPRAPVTIAFALQGDRCTARVGGRRYAVPEDSERIAAYLARLKAQNRRVRLAMDGDVPYRCVGATLFAAQRLGVQVGFAAEPAPER